KTSIFSHPVYLFLRKFSLQDSRGGSEGMTTQQKKEMAALVQKQIESLRAQLEQLLRQQAEKKNEDATVQPDKKEEKKDDTNTAGTIDIYV
ncbi:FlxA-like family protein, partial [Escherichia coli]|uniref:FlxA-like family protein n=1 Tax=Escherichia coli TaxID=562 RepID=UPI00208DA869